MLRRTIAIAFLLIVGWASHAIAAQEEGAGNLVRLAGSLVADDKAPLVFKDLALRGRVTTVRIIARNGDCTIDRVVIHYGNGQVHYEDRTIALNESGRRSAMIDPRVEERLVERVEITFKPGACGGGVLLDVLGAQRSAAIPGIEKSTVQKSVPARRRIISGDEPDPGTPKGLPQPTAEPAAQLPYSEVDIFFGTNRMEEAKRRREGGEIASFGPRPTSQLKVGKAVVTVPIAGRTEGQITRPEFKVMSLSYEPEDKARHFTLLKVDVQDFERFKSEAKAHTKAKGVLKDHAFVFVHGYNVSFDDALFRAAQMTYDMDFAGRPFVFSWPSKGTLLGYSNDREHSVSARKTLSEFIAVVQEIMGDARSAKNIHFIAHSMGTQALIGALETYAKPPGHQGPLFGQVIFAASDVNQSSFELATPQIAALASGVTLYASSKDWALTISKKLRGNEVPVGLIQTSGLPFIFNGVELDRCVGSGYRLFRAQPLDLRRSQDPDRGHASPVRRGCSPAQHAHGRLQAADLAAQHWHVLALCGAGNPLRAQLAPEVVRRAPSPPPAWPARQPDARGSQRPRACRSSCRQPAV